MQPGTGSGVFPSTDRSRTEEATMIPVLLIGAHLTIAVADPVPSFNVEPSCRQAASGDIGIKQDFTACLDDEKGAREQLVKEWSEFTPADRSLCTRLSTTGGAPTYTELLTCLEISRDARKLPKDTTLGVGP
jgi:hypothetical protein